MYDLLEILYDYSASEKKADRDFIEDVMYFYKDTSKDYLRSIKYDHINQNFDDPDKFCPMEYSYFDKQIIIDEETLDKNFIVKMLNFQMHGYDEFEKYMLFNSEVLYYLLHEIDHSVQYKKSVEDDGSFESSLLKLCFYPEVEILGKSTFSIALMLTSKKLFNYSSKLSMLDRMAALNRSFDRVVPYERLAQIDAAKQVLGLLTAFSTFMKDIPAVVSRFKRLTLDQYMVGYGKNTVAPLVRYIDAVKDLDIPKLSKMAIDLENRFGELDTVDDKLKFGLAVTSREKEEFKRRTLR